MLNVVSESKKKNNFIHFIATIPTGSGSALMRIRAFFYPGFIKNRGGQDDTSPGIFYNKNTFYLFFLQIWCSNVRSDSCFLFRIGCTTTAFRTTTATRTGIPGSSSFSSVSSATVTSSPPFLSGQKQYDNYSQVPKPVRYSSGTGTVQFLYRFGACNSVWWSFCILCLA